LATREEEPGETTFFGKTASLYRTVNHRFFRLEYDGDGGEPIFELLTKGQAMDFYETLPSKNVDWEEAFESD
jgi:hypothetical protein